MTRKVASLVSGFTKTNRRNLYKIGNISKEYFSTIHKFLDSKIMDELKDRESELHHHEKSKDNLKLKFSFDI